MKLMQFFAGAFRLYDVDNDGYITRVEMFNIVDAIYQMVVSSHGYIYTAVCMTKYNNVYLAIISTVFPSFFLSSLYVFCFSPLNWVKSNPRRRRKSQIM